MKFKHWEVKKNAKWAKKDYKNIKWKTQQIHIQGWRNCRLSEIFVGEIWVRSVIRGWKMDRRENHPNTLRRSGQCRRNTVFSNGRLFVSISPFFGRVLISKSLYPRSFIYHNPSFLPSPKGLFCILFLLLINYWFTFLQTCSPKVGVATDKLSMCEVSQGSFEF